MLRTNGLEFARDRNTVCKNSTNLMLWYPIPDVEGYGKETNIPFVSLPIHEWSDSSNSLDLKINN